MILWMCLCYTFVEGHIRVHRDLIILSGADDYEGRISGTDICSPVRTNHLEEFRKHRLPYINGYVVLVAIVFNIANTAVVYPMARLLEVCVSDDTQSCTMSELTQGLIVNLMYQGITAELCSGCTGHSILRTTFFTRRI